MSRVLHAEARVWQPFALGQSSPLVELQQEAGQAREHDPASFGQADQCQP